MKHNQPLKYSHLLILILVIITGLLLTACGGGAQAKETFTIGVVNNTPSLNPSVDGLKAGLAELGYIEGTNVTYLYDGPLADTEAIKSTLQNLKEQKVDLLVTLGTAATTEAKEILAGTDTPIVFAPVNNPVKSGIVESLAKPGGNFTGVQSGISTPKRLEWLLTIVPDIKHIFVPHNPDESSSVVALKDLTEAAAGLGVELDVHEARTPDEIKALSQAIPAEADAVFILGASSLSARTEDFVKAALERKLPMTGSTKNSAELGGLMSYGIDSFSVGKQAARLVDQILKGGKPGDLPVETGDLFLVINLRTAKTIGLDIPDKILRQADTIIR